MGSLHARVDLYGGDIDLCDTTQTGRRRRHRDADDIRDRDR